MVTKGYTPLKKSVVSSKDHPSVCCGYPSPTPRVCKAASRACDNKRAVAAAPGEHNIRVFAANVA